MTLLSSIANLGGPDLIVILLIVLVLFGAKRLPDLARGMGQAMREFHKTKDDLGQELHYSAAPEPAPASVSSSSVASLRNSSAGEPETARSGAGRSATV